MALPKFRSAGGLDAAKFGLADNFAKYYPQKVTLTSNSGNLTEKNSRRLW